MGRGQSFPCRSFEIEDVDCLYGIRNDEVFRLLKRLEGRTPQFGMCPSNYSDSQRTAGQKSQKRATRANHLVTFNVNVSSVGPDVPRGSRLGPDRWNRVLGFFRLGSIRKPIKQFCISSQFCSPQKISLAGSGLYLLFAELSSWAIPTIRVPFGMGRGFAKSKPSCQLKSHLALKIVSVFPSG